MPAGARETTQLSTNLQLRHGLDAFGSGLNASDLADDPRRADFLVTLMQASAYRRFADRWSLRLDMFSQNSGYVLPDSERFKIGGDRLGRGFEVAEIAGDSGIGGKLELRRDLMNTERSSAGSRRMASMTSAPPGSRICRGASPRRRRVRASRSRAQRSPVISKSPRHSPVPTSRANRRASVFAEISYRF